MSRMSAERQAQLIAEAQAQTKAAKAERGRAHQALNVAAMHQVATASKTPRRG